jgi:hypothetical protein
VPSKSVSSTPYELWNGVKPNLGYFHPWGCAAYIHNTSHEYGKLGPRGKKCIFIRYSEHSKGFVFIGEKADGRVTEIESRDVVFLEKVFPKTGEVEKDFQLYEMKNLDYGETSHSVEDLDETFNPLRNTGSDILSIPSLMEQDHEQSLPRRSIREPIPRRRFEIEGEAFMIAPQDDEEPKTFNHALSGPKASEWIKAMEEEMELMKINQVWDLVDLPSGRRSIGNKWVLKIKHKADGSIERYKARLVAKGYTKEEGIDYEDTFSPVVRITSVRLILAIVAHMDLELYQMDVRTAFLNGELNEEIYMDQPLGFETKGQERKVCKLKRSIYGLKQASRQWNVKFHQAILKDGFIMMEEDHCVYLKHSNNSFIILSLYVDDILIARNNKEMIDTTKKWLSSNFEMKDMGKASYVLGVKIIRDHPKRLLGLTQETYIKKMLERYHM